MRAMTYELPLFPLHMVLFPSMPVHLYIFELRYRLMMREVLQSNQTFGVVLIQHGMESLGPLAKTYKIGTAARIVEVEPLEGGTINIAAIGTERFRILKTTRDHPYLIAQVEPLPLDIQDERAFSGSAARLRNNVRGYLAMVTELMRNAKKDEERMDLNELELPEDPQTFVQMAASLLQLPTIEKQDLLSSESMDVLVNNVARLYRRELQVNPHLQDISEQEAARAAWLN